MNSTGSNDDRSQQGAHLAESAAYWALSQIVLADRPLDQTLDEVVILARQALPETPEVSVTLVTDDQAWTAAFSGGLALQLDERQYDRGHGPCLDAAASGETIMLTIADPDSPYPHWRQIGQEHTVTHSLSIGLPAAGRSVGALNLYINTGQPFTADSRRIAGTFAGIAGIVLATHGRHDDAAAAAAQLKQALDSRAVISQAQGILMAQHRYNRDQAFTALLQLSEDQALKLQDTAQHIVNQTSS